MRYLTGDFSDGWHDWSVGIPLAYRTTQFRFAFVLKTNEAGSSVGYCLDNIALQDNTHAATDGNAFFCDGAETANLEWEQPRLANWEYMGSLTGGSEGAWVDYNVTIDDWLIWNRFRFAFVLDPGDDDLQGGGVCLDDIGVGVPTNYSHTYAYASGTSMAAPYVSGALALMAAYHPYESMAGRIYRILAGTDRLPSLEGEDRNRWPFEPDEFSAFHRALRGRFAGRLSRRRCGRCRPLCFNSRVQHPGLRYGVGLRCRF